MNNYSVITSIIKKCCHWFLAPLKFTFTKLMLVNSACMIRRVLRSHAYVHTCNVLLSFLLFARFQCTAFCRIFKMTNNLCGEHYHVCSDTSNFAFTRADKPFKCMPEVLFSPCIMGRNLTQFFVFLCYISPHVSWLWFNNTPGNINSFQSRFDSNPCVNIFKYFFHKKISPIETMECCVEYKFGFRLYV